MDRAIESLLAPPQSVQRAWQWSGLLLFCLTQQGCLCGCSHTPPVQVTAAPKVLIANASVVCSDSGDALSADQERSVSLKDRTHSERSQKP